MASLYEIVRYSDQLLRVNRFRDYCPNGLQIEGREQVFKMATGVTANMEVVEQAIEWDADILLVHHGYFWKNEPVEICGMKKKRIAALLCANVSLLAYHLPLDAHEELGNNAQLGVLLEIPCSEALNGDDANSIGNVGNLPEACEIGELVEKVEGLLGRAPLIIAGGPPMVRRIAWCTGAAQHLIEQAVKVDADVYISGEISEHTVHVANECGIHYISAGHNATERYGVQALASHLAERFSLEYRHFDSENPV